MNFSKSNKQTILSDFPVTLATARLFEKSNNLAHFFKLENLHSYKNPEQTNRIASIENKKSGADISKHVYAYDPNGNRLTMRETNIHTNQLIDYTYDKADRLTSVEYPNNEKTTYVLDKIGNRDSEIITGLNPNTKTYGYNNRDQLVTISDTLGSNTAYTFDTSGNQLTKDKDGILTTFDYTARQRVKSITIGADNPINYQYDFTGQRINHQSNGMEKRFVYDGLTLIAETNTIGNVLAKYHYGSDRALAETRNGQNSYIYHDALRTPIAITNQDGSIQNRMDYDVYGNLLTESGSSENPFGFTGYQKDDDTGLYYANARYYDSETARFNREDPFDGDVNTPPSLHRYLYANANPTYYIDPTGKYGEVGHYYTTYYVALSVGYSSREARQLAVFSQGPDETEANDAISQQAYALGASGGRERIQQCPHGDCIPNRQVENIFRDNIQQYLHSLTGGSSQLATDEAREAVLKDNDLAVTGVAIHRFADSFAHRKIGNESILYNTGFGHLDDGHSPDQIHLRPELYLSYVDELTNTLSDKRNLNDYERLVAKRKSKDFAQNLFKEAGGGEITPRIATKALYGSFYNKADHNTSDELMLDYPEKHNLYLTGLFDNFFFNRKLNSSFEDLSSWWGPKFKLRQAFWENDIAEKMYNFMLPLTGVSDVNELKKLNKDEILRLVDDRLKDAVKKNTPEYDNSLNVIMLNDNAGVIVE